MTSPAQPSPMRLEEIVGPSHVVTNPAELSAWRVNHKDPRAAVQPTEAAQVAEIIRYAGAGGLGLIPSGGRTKLGIGLPPTRYDIALDLSRMNRVLAYDPEDLTLGVEPGVRVEDLRRTLLEEKQFLPLAVPFADRATLGGIAAANSNSPMRHSYGGVRDFCLGMEFVTGDGLQAKSGGRVVKNVTGYDLHKLLIGSLGTLAVITRLNFRTFPIPPVQRTFVASFRAAEPAFEFCQAIANSVLMPEIVEIADPAAAAIMLTKEPLASIDGRLWSVVIRTTGQSAVVNRCDQELSQLAVTAKAASLDALAGSDASSLLSGICEFPQLVLGTNPSALIFRIGLLPSALPSLHGIFSRLANRNRLGLVTLSRATGFMYAALLPERGTECVPAAMANIANEIFQACSAPEISAQTMLEWCPTEINAAVGTLWGTPRADSALMKRMKVVFDPKGILSPGRFAREI
jgi:glycolate oxidase FAD binding subunit